MRGRSEESLGSWGQMEEGGAAREEMAASKAVESRTKKKSTQQEGWNCCRIGVVGGSVGQEGSSWQLERSRSVVKSLGWVEGWQLQTGAGVGRRRAGRERKAGERRSTLIHGTTPKMLQQHFKSDIKIQHSLDYFPISG